MRLCELFFWFLSLFGFLSSYLPPFPIPGEVHCIPRSFSNTLLNASTARWLVMISPAYSSSPAPSPLAVVAVVTVVPAVAVAVAVVVVVVVVVVV